jgi:tetratricopeptide (TPR) repeat protein
MLHRDAGAVEAIGVCYARAGVPPMTIADRYGLPVSTSSAVAAQRYQEGMDRQLSYGPGAEEGFAAAIAADQSFAMPHAGAALMALFRGDGPAARSAIGRARDLAAGATRRERQHVEALGTLVAGETARGLALVDEHVAEFPRDALLVNQASSTIGFSGRPDREEFRRAFLERLAPAYGEDWWFQSALAFTYHEVGRYAESRRLSEHSLAQYPGNAHASHNIAHVCFETLDNDGGLAFLGDWLDGYDRRAPFHCHLAWHLSLFELHRGDDRRALEICERDVLGSSNGRLALIDGAALLWRLHLDGCADGALPWQPLAELAARSSRPGFIFGDIHAALAYAASGDEAALSALVDGLRALAAKGHPTASVALPLVEAAAAFGAGDLAGALTYLEPVEDQMHRMGGSHAQWELFEETMVVCYLRLGRHEQAARLLRRRLAHRQSTRDLAWLGSAEAGRAAAQRV